MNRTWYVWLSLIVQIEKFGNVSFHCPGKYYFVYRLFFRHLASSDKLQITSVCNIRTSLIDENVGRRLEVPVCFELDLFDMR